MTAPISSANLSAKGPPARRTALREESHVHRGRVVFGAMDEVVFGRAAREAIVEQLDRLGAQRAFLMVSGTLNRETDEIEKVRQALGSRCVGTFDRMPAHTPRAAVIAATEQARDAQADLIVTIGGGLLVPGVRSMIWPEPIVHTKKPDEIPSDPDQNGNDDDIEPPPAEPDAAADAEPSEEQQSGAWLA